MTPPVRLPFPLCICDFKMFLRLFTDSKFSRKDVANKLDFVQQPPSSFCRLYFSIIL